MRTSRHRPFYEYLREQRARHGIELNRLAIAARVDLPRLVALESGVAEPEKQELRRLARALDLPLETMLAKAGRV